MTRDPIYEIANYYGLEAQKQKCIEELAELIRALAEGIDENIIEELADVKLMTAQMEYLMDVEEKVEDVTDFKTRRTLEQIDRLRAQGRTTWMKED